MKRKIMMMIAALAVVTSAKAEDPVHHGVEYRVCAGFNIGGSSPMGLPAEIRKISSYSPTLNLSVGARATKMLTGKWGIGAGLVFETKGMNTGIEAKNYHLTMNIVQGDDTGTKTGYFTGKIKNSTKVSYVTVPVFVEFRPFRNWHFSGGLHFSYAFNRTFTGKVSDGKMREDPLHPAIGISEAKYDYSGDIRRFDMGVDLGVSRRIYRSLSVRADLQWGVLSTLSPSTRKIDMNTYNVYLNLGLTYAI